MPDVMRAAYRQLSDLEQTTMFEVKKLAEDLHTRLELIGQSRELALAKTNLEQAVMWAVKHITK